MTADIKLATVGVEQLATVTGGEFKPTVENCKAAYQTGKITNGDLKKLEGDLGYRGKTQESRACFAAAARGDFGWSADAVKRRFGATG